MPVRNFDNVKRELDYISRKIINVSTVLDYISGNVVNLKNSIYLWILN